METKSKTINYFQCKVSELLEEEKKVVFQAQSAINGSYSPYSKFRVGSAVLLENGDIVMGANQENGAYPSGMCAERVALFYAGANYKDNKIKIIAISAKNEKGEFTLAYPCGACLQVMKETEIGANENLRIIVQINDAEVQIFNGVKSLFPFSFSL